MKRKIRIPQPDIYWDSKLTIVENFKAIRKSTGWTIRELAEYFNTTRVNMNGYLLGYWNVSSPEVLLAIREKIPNGKNIVAEHVTKSNRRNGNGNGKHQAT